MDTNYESSQSNNFIYALGLICFMNINSSEITNVDEDKYEDVRKTILASENNTPIDFLI